MKKTLVIVGVIFLLVIVGSASWFLSKATKTQNQIIAENPTVSQNNSNLRYANIAYSKKITLSKGKGVTKEAASCIECHAQKTPAIVQDWLKSSMAHAGVSCIDCHGVSKDNPMANQNCPGVKRTNIYVSKMVSPKTCAKCHPNEVKEFEESGHARGALHIPLKTDQELLAHECMGMPQYKDAVLLTGCAQCHGSIIEMGPNHEPTQGTWPSHGIGNVYPDGGVGNCASCHFRHQFSIAQARKPSSCATCHLGPDHPNIEVYDNSVHGALFAAHGDKWNWDSPVGAWVPGVDYNAPTCATCHMSGVNGLQPTHNVSMRLKWNLWAPISKERTGGYETAAFEYMKTGKFTAGNPLAGNPKGPQEARKEMLQVCASCHTSSFAKNYLAMADKQIELYNKYAHAASEMINTLEKKHLNVSFPMY